MKLQLLSIVQYIILYKNDFLKFISVFYTFYSCLLWKEALGNRRKTRAGAEIGTIDKQKTNIIAQNPANPSLL